MSLEHIRVSRQAREQLIRLKRHTGIEHWNVLCRWAFCRSLAEPGVPPPARIPADSNVEMSWRVLDVQFRLHLHRGIAYLANDRRTREGIAAFVGQAVA